MLGEIFVPFLVVGLAELGDKTQISVLLLASKTKQHLALLFGVMLAFLIVDGIAVLTGNWITAFVPIHYLKFASSIFFIIMGIIILCGKQEQTSSIPILQKPFYAGFMLIFLSEWGDKTQLSSVVLSLKYPLFSVLIGVMLALFILSLSAVYLGKFIVSKLSENMITKLAGTVFIILGIAALFI